MLLFVFVRPIIAIIPADTMIGKIPKERLVEWKGSVSEATHHKWVWMSIEVDTDDISPCAIPAFALQRQSNPLATHSVRLLFRTA